jgi:hypothetical protein
MSEHTLISQPNPHRKFCRACGRKLIPDTRILCYDEATGKPILAQPEGQICPNHPLVWEGWE